MPSFQILWYIFFIQANLKMLVRTCIISLWVIFSLVAWGSIVESRYLDNPEMGKITIYIWIWIRLQEIHMSYIDYLNLTNSFYFIKITSYTTSMTLIQDLRSMFALVLCGEFPQRKVIKLSLLCKLPTILGLNWSEESFSTLQLYFIQATNW